MTEPENASGSTQTRPRPACSDGSHFLIKGDTVTVLDYRGNTAVETLWDCERCGHREIEVRYV